MIDQKGIDRMVDLRYPLRDNPNISPRITVYNLRQMGFQLAYRQGIIDYLSCGRGKIMVVQTNISSVEHDESLAQVSAANK